MPVGPYTNRGYHGYLASNSSMNAAFIVAGRKIKREVKIGVIENIDVAPTVAHLLGQKLASVDGKILGDVFDKP